MLERWYTIHYFWMSESIIRLLEYIADETTPCDGDGSYFEHRNICTCGRIICSQMMRRTETDLISCRGELKMTSGDSYANPSPSLSINEVLPVIKILLSLFRKKTLVKAFIISVDLISSFVGLCEIYSPTL